MAARDALVFTGEQGGPLRPHVLQKHWARARLKAGRPELHLHDLRHTGNTWAAATGASTRELMTRMGHRTSDAALRYQHATEDRDRVIAEALANMARPAPVVAIAAGTNLDYSLAGSVLAFSCFGGGDVWLGRRGCLR